MSLVRPLPWARAVPGLRFEPEHWGPGVFRIAAPGGSHLLIRQRGLPELALWLPAKLAPRAGEPFGLYLHPGQQHANRVRAAHLLWHRIGVGPALRAAGRRDAHRQVVMLFVHDQLYAGASLRDVADRVLDLVPEDWRTSSQRSDLRRLADAGMRMIEREYLSLLGQPKAATPPDQRHNRLLSASIFRRSGSFE